MKRASLAMMLVLPMAFAACAKKPEPVPVPVMSAGEQACVDRAVATTGADPTSVAVTPTASTKTGDTIYTVTANGVGYSCVVAPDLTVASFSAQ